MVVWEITLGTAYFLGLKRTYKLGLKIQRKLISPKHPKLRQFLHRRTRYVFDMALKVHLKVQERDIEYGRSLGNWILRWLDRMKPEAQIRGKPPPSNSTITSVTKQSNNSNNKMNLPKSGATSTDKDSGRHLFTATLNVWPKTLPTIAMTMRPMRLAGLNIQYRQYNMGGCDFFSVKNGKFGTGEVIRNDKRQWIMYN